MKNLQLKYLVLASVVFLFSSSVFATSYKLFVHGRSSSNHCVPATPGNLSSMNYDKEGYWGNSVTGLSNVRFVGFDGTKNGGAYSWSSCGAQKQLNDALSLFCTGGNSCEIYTHSTGGLVVAAYFGMNNPPVNVSRIQLMANAAGGSELADFSTSYLGWLGFDTMGGELDQSVSVNGARNGFNHNQSYGRVYYTTSGEGTDYLYATSPLLPGYDDGVLANHTLCNINSPNTVNKSCTRGNSTMRESYSCGFLWLKTCYKNHYRWSPYYSVYQGGSSESHSTAKNDYNKR